MNESQDCPKIPREPVVIMIIIIIITVVHVVAFGHAELRFTSTLPLHTLAACLVMLLRRIILSPAEILREFLVCPRRNVLTIPKGAEMFLSFEAVFYHKSA